MPGGVRRRRGGREGGRVRIRVYTHTYTYIYGYGFWVERHENLLVDSNGGDELTEGDGLSGLCKRGGDELIRMNVTLDKVIK